MIKIDALIVGAGPVGLFAVHQLGIKGLKSEVVDNLDKAGGQCIELYPDKPIYDIAGIPECTGEELTKNLLEQIKPFKTNFHFNERVQEITNEGNQWIVKTSKNKVFSSPNIIIAGGVGSFEPRKLSVKDAEKYEGKNIFYSVTDKNKFSGKKIKDIVNIGIGGSDLGPRLVCDALEDFKVGEHNLHFVSNVDPSHFDEVVSELKPETTIFIVASKSFNTPETALNAAIAKKWLLEACDAPVAIEKHFIAITSNKNGAINFGVAKDNIFPIWDWVGGRYSVWSAIGLPVALSVGIESFIAFHAGAHSMDRHFKEESAEKNMPVIMALITIWYNAFFNCQSSAVVPYSHRLKELPFYLQQLSMESLGKSVTKEGNPVDGAVASLVFGMTGTNAQHSFSQLLHQGPSFAAAEFIGISEQGHSLIGHHDKLLANMI